MAAKSFRAILLGDPPDPTHQVVQRELYDKLVEVEGAVTYGIVAYEDDLADLPAASGVANGSFAIVLNDATESNRGLYQEQSNAWVKVADLPEIIASHSHAATDISDSTTTGRNVLKAADAAAARTALGGTSTGGSLFTAADAAAARTAIDAASTASVTAKADRSVRLAAAGRVLAEDIAGQAMIVTDENGKVDFEPSDDLRRRLGVATMANATIGLFPAGQSAAASINEQAGEAPNIVSRGRVRSRRRYPQIMMPNDGLGVHGTSLVTDGLVSGRNRSINTFGPFNAFVPADERINQRPGEKVAWSWGVPAAETLLDCLGEDLPEVVVCSIGNGSQPLDEADAPERVGLHIDTGDAHTVFYDRAVDVITTAIDVAAERGKPMTDVFIPFIWGNAVFGADPGFAGTTAEAETYRDQIDAYFTDLKADILAHDASVNVHFLIVAPHGNSTRGNYPVRLSARMVADDRADTWLVGSDYVQTFDGTHYTEDGKALMGALIGHAMHAVLMDRMWTIPQLSIARSGQTITLTSDIPLREVPWFSTGGSVKGVTLSGGTVTSVTMPDAYTITVACSGADTGQYLAIGYRGAISGEAAVPSPDTLDDLPMWPRAFSPFALLRKTCWSGVLPGQEMPIFLDPQILEVP